MWRDVSNDDEKEKQNMKLEITITWGALWLAQDPKAILVTRGSNTFPFPSPSPAPLFVPVATTPTTPTATTIHHNHRLLLPIYYSYYY